MNQAAPPPENWKELHLAQRLDGLRKRLFTVVGPHLVHGKSKGEVIEVEITDAQADALIIAGHVTEKFEPTAKVDIVKVAEATEPPRVVSSAQTKTKEN